MALLLTLKDISIAFGGPKILDNVTLNIGERERIALMGRNGEGKSTLMKIVSGVLHADEGEIIRHKQKLRIAFMMQEVPGDSPQTAKEVVLAAFESVDDAQLMSDKDHHWEIEHKAEKILSQVGIEPEAIFSTLSGGQRRRVLLARAMVIEPDVLLLDEPTNHMDLDTIVWMENELLAFTGSVMFVTHDRYFLKKIATKVVEVDRGVAFAWDCKYDEFLERKDAWLEAEEKRNAAFDKKLAQEEEWVRRGVKARATRNEGRVRALMKMRAERQQRRSRVGKVSMTVHEAEESGRLIFKIHNLGFAYPDKMIVDKFTNVIMRGDRLAVMGANGCGKSTFLKLLLGKLQPQVGNVKTGVSNVIAYFDQCREGLDENATVVENVSGGATFVKINGKDVHVYGYLRRFLFPIDRADTPVKALSGGEKNRLLLAKLFANPSNVLVLDEPTNDLDMQTLDLLEDLLLQYDGTVILVTHDRDFINNVATSSFVYEGNGYWHEYIGGYDDWRQQSGARDEHFATDTAPKKRKDQERDKDADAAPKKRVLKYTEKHELEKLPVRIEEAEARLKDLHDQMADPAFYQKNHDQVKKISVETDSLGVEVKKMYDRWEELEWVRLQSE